MDIMTFEESVKEFEYHINIEKNYSRKTIKTYKNNLRDFGNFLCKHVENCDINSINRELMKKYLIELKNVKSNEPATINNKISTLKSLYKFLVDKRMLDESENWTLELKQQKVPKKLPIYLSFEESETLLLATKLFSRNAYRDYGLMCVFLLTGARLSEIASLKTDQINLNERSIRLIGKGSKERTVPLAARACIALQDYLNNRQERLSRVTTQRAKNEIVFLNKDGNPLSERGIQYIVLNMFEKARINKPGLSVHKLRHTCFTQLYNSGTNILALKELAGHENIKTTEIYTHINHSELQKYVNNNPLNINSYDNTFIRIIKEKFGAI